MNDQPTPIAPDPLPTSFHEPAPIPGNLAIGFAAGAVAALMGAAIWAGVTCATKYQIGWMAIGVGFLVGFAVKKFGHGQTPAFGILGGALALFGCLLGNFLAGIGMFAIQENANFFQVLSSFPPSAIPAFFQETFSPMDVLFYGIAVFQGYKVAMSPPKTA